MIFLFSAFAADIFVPSCQDIEGPAVAMDEATYRRYVSDSRALPGCLARADDLQSRLEKCGAIAARVLDEGDESDVELLDRIEKMARKLDRAKRGRARMARLLGVAVGAASVSTGMLLLTR